MMPIKKWLIFFTTVTADRKPRLSDIMNRVKGGVHPIVWVGVALAILQQFTGINVVFYYGATLWQAAGFTEGDALLVNVISGAVNISFTFVAIALVDKIGRKPLLLVGSLGQAVMLGILALFFGTATLGESGNLILEGNNGIYALLAANAYIAFFAFFLGTGNVGYARRDVPEPVPWRRPGRLRNCPVGRQFCHYHELPGAAGLHRTRIFLRNLCFLRCHRLFLRETLCG